MEMGRWILRSAPPSAVLVTNGDWDYFPIMIAQAVEGVRPDVTVMLRSFWEFPWYARQVAVQAGYPLPPEVDSGPDEWAPAEEHAGSLGALTGAAWARATLEGARPLVIAGSALPDEVVGAAWPRWDGALYTLRPLDEAPEDGTTLRIDAEAFAASMRHLDIRRLHGPVVHPGDRSPVRRNAVHPADFVILPVIYYGSQGVADGNLDQARQALAWADALIATGHVSAERIQNVAELRTALAEIDSP